MPGSFVSKLDNARSVFTFRDFILLPGRSKTEPGEIDLSSRLTKNIKIYERVNFQFEYTLTNVFNHPVFYDPSLNPSGGVSQFGIVNSQGNNPRQMQFGLRLTF